MKKEKSCVSNYDGAIAKSVREAEEKTDEYEDILGSYLVKLGINRVSERDGAESAMLLKIIGDIERISDHAVNLVESSEELKNKKIQFSEDAKREMDILCTAVCEIVNLSYTAFAKNDFDAARCVEPLEQIIDKMKEHLRSQHILRLQQGGCSIPAGFVWSDLLTNLERTADHCSNIAACVIETSQYNMNIHESLRVMKSDSPFFKEQYQKYAEKYLLEMIP